MPDHNIGYETEQWLTNLESRVAALEEASGITPEEEESEDDDTDVSSTLDATSEEGEY